MTDLITRLRSRQRVVSTASTGELAGTVVVVADHLCQEAADEIERLRAAAEQARAALQMTLMLKRLGGMLPGTHEMVQLTVEEAEGALRALDEALK